MTIQAEWDMRVVEAAEAWLADPMKRSLYGALVSAVRSRRAACETTATLPTAMPLTTPPRVGSAPAAMAPKQHRDREFLARKQSRLLEEHVAPVQALVDEIREERGTDSVPYVDPDSGGVGAKVLFILESPARPAALGSGMLSPDNDDETAANMWRLYEQSGLPRSAGLHWNAVPWYVGENGKEKNVSHRDVLEGGLWLDRLLDLLPDLRLIVTMGKPAAMAFKTYSIARDGQHAAWASCLHPSPRNKATRPERWAEVEEVFLRAAKVAGT